MYALIDIGGSTVRVAHTASLAHPIFDEIQSFAPCTNGDDAERQLISAIARDDCTVQGIGIGILGQLDTRRTFVWEAFPYGVQWVDRQLKTVLSERFRCAVALDNDNANAARGEACFGQSRDAKFLWIGCGTGNGVSLVTPHLDERNIEIVNLDGHPLVTTLQVECDSRNVERRLGKSAIQFTDVDWNTYFNEFLRRTSKLVEAFRPRTALSCVFTAMNQPAADKNAAGKTQETRRRPREPRCALRGCRGGVGQQKDEVLVVVVLVVSRA